MSSVHNIINGLFMSLKLMRKENDDQKEKHFLWMYYKVWGFCWLIGICIMMSFCVGEICLLPLSDGVLLCVGGRAAPSCVHFVTVSLSPVRAVSPVSGWGTHSLGHVSNVLQIVLNILWHTVKNSEPLLEHFVFYIIFNTWLCLCV